MAIAIAAEMGFLGIGTDDGDVFVFVAIERQEGVLIFEEGDGFVCGFESKFLVLRAVGDFFGESGIDVWIVEEAEQEFRTEDAGDGAIDEGFRDFAVADLLRKGEIGSGERELDIDAGFDGHASGDFVVGGNMVESDEIGESEIVGNDDALKTPFLAEDLIQEVSVGVGRNAVDFIVGRHERGGVGFGNGSLEGAKEVFADDALGIIAGANVGAGLGLAMNGKMFGGGHDVRFVDRRAGTLEAEDGGDTDARGEIGILAIGFFGAAPAGIAGEIENGRQALLRAAGAHFLSNGGEDVVNENWIPSGGEADGLRVRSAAGSGIAVEAFFMEEDGNAEAGIFGEPLLQGVGEGSHFARAAIFAGARNSAEAVF